MSIFRGCKVNTTMSADADKPVILLVEDTPANIHIAQSILKDDYRIRVATSGAKALELVKTKPVPALILLDVEMPEMDGYEVCRRLKADAQTRDIPVIFLTGKTETESETKGFEVGAVDYVHKPFSPPVVKARVRTHLALRAVSEQLAEQLLTINNELEMAREIQLAILPRETPKLKGLEIAARYLPMSTVAGDFYDFIILDDKHVGVLIADVSGHGLPAALIASMLQVSLTAQLSHAAEPGRVLAGLNRRRAGNSATILSPRLTCLWIWKRIASATRGRRTRRCCCGARQRGVLRKSCRTGCCWAIFRTKRTACCTCLSGRAIRPSYTRTESSKPITRRKECSDPTASSSFWNRIIIPERSDSPIHCWRSCRAGLGIPRGKASEMT